jgi:hypothetical protein
MSEHGSDTVHQHEHTQSAPASEPNHEPAQSRTSDQHPLVHDRAQPHGVDVLAHQAQADNDAAPLPSPAALPPNVHAFLTRAFPGRVNTLPNDAVLLLGIALALAAVDPTKLGSRGPVGWLFALAALVATIWAAPVVSRRPAAQSVRLTSQVARHRNTVFAVGCTIMAGFSDPPVWLMVIDAALLLAYLLAVDALAAGPVGIRQLRRGTAPLSALAAVAIVLLAAQAPVNSGAVWGRIVAALAVAAAATAAGAALWIRQTAGQSSRAGREEAPTRPRHR